MVSDKNYYYRYKMLVKCSYLLLGFVTCIAVFGLFAFPKDYPPYLDFDASTDSAFVNNLNYRDSYDFHFKDSENPQDRYRVNYATVRLPYSIPISFLQLAFGVLPIQMEIFSKILAGVFTLGGLLCAARLAQILLSQANPTPEQRADADPKTELTATVGHEKNESLSEVFFIFAMGCTYPPLLLLSRSGFHFQTMVFFLFWAILLCVGLYAKLNFTSFAMTTNNRASKTPSSSLYQARHLYLAALLFAYALINPYPCLLPLPFCVIGLLHCQHQLGNFLRSKHTYLAATLAILSIIAMSVYLAYRYTGDFQTYLERIQRFVATRERSAVAHNSDSLTGTYERILKIANQQIFFVKDKLGDTSRSDAIWTLGRPIWSFTWIFFPLVLFGIITGLRQNTAIAKFSGLVLLSFALIFFNRHFPEGRYIIPLAPCYIFFAIIALRWAIENKIAIRLGQHRALALTLRNLTYASIIAICMVPTYNALTSSYQNEMRSIHANYEDILELSENLPKLSPNAHALVVLHRDWAYKPSLYFGLLTNFQFSWINMNELLGGLERHLYDKQLIYLLADASQPLNPLLLEQTLRHELARFVGRPHPKTKQSHEYILFQLIPK